MICPTPLYYDHFINQSAQGNVNINRESPFRTVFQTTEVMRMEFAKFLNTIFYQLDGKKVLDLMQEIINDPNNQNKTDEDIYNEILTKISRAKRRLPFLLQLVALSVLKNGLGRQIKQLMQGFDPKKFNNYMEIYDRRYVSTIRTIAKFSLRGSIIAVSNIPNVGFINRIEAGALFSRYPYKHVPLNDEDCENPLLTPDKTNCPIQSTYVGDNEIDLIACLGGLHHIPEERMEPFVASMHRTLRPGGVLLLREHDVIESNQSPAHLTKEEMIAMACVVHSFVNAAAGQSWDVEKAELRYFQGVSEWSAFMQQMGFTPISKASLVLKDDPTENRMFAFIKSPQDLTELRTAIDYRNDCKRPRWGSRATWIEWANVGYAQHYANHIAYCPSYSFDYMGHMRQHWSHFYYFAKESLKDNQVSRVHSLFNEGILMNLFILSTTSVECVLGAMTSLPSKGIAKFKYGENWRSRWSHLTALELLDIRFAREYADGINTVPFYSHPYIGRIKEVWSTLLDPKDSYFTKLFGLTTIASSSLRFLAMGIVSAPIRYFYTQEANREPEAVKILIKDRNNQIEGMIEKWNTEKKDRSDSLQGSIEVIYAAKDGHKLVSIPRYRAFTQIFKHLSQLDVKLLEIGGQSEISVALLVKSTFDESQIQTSRKIYELKSLQDEDKRYLIYQVGVAQLKKFQLEVGVNNIYHIYE